MAIGPASITVTCPGCEAKIEVPLTTTSSLKPPTITVSISDAGSEVIKDHVARHLRQLRGAGLSGLA